MIGKPQWFTRRKWGGWGVYPVAWQGWVYLAIFVALIFGTQFLPGSDTVRMGSLLVVAMLLVIDTIDIMTRIKKDERETLHEAIAERNALWAIVLALALGAAYQAAQSLVREQIVAVDPVIIIALVIGLAVKAASNYYLDRKN